jgi:hypothetical protein
VSKAPVARKVMLDTNVYDLVVTREGFAGRLDRAVRDGHVEILRTHVQEEEIARIPDAARRAAMRQVRGAVRVTEDKEFRLRAKAPGRLDVWRFSELVDYVESLSD